MGRIEDLEALQRQSVGTLNTIEALDTVQHIFGFQCLIRSAILKTSEESPSEQGDSLKKYCDDGLALLTTIEGDRERLFPFLNGVKDALLCIKAMPEENYNDT